VCTLVSLYDFQSVTSTTVNLYNFLPRAGVELETAEKLPLVEWFATNYKNFGATLEFVTNRSQEGSQFVKGFGGIGGILRYKVDFLEHDYDDDDDDGNDSDAY